MPVTQAVSAVGAIASAESFGTAALTRAALVTATVDKTAPGGTSQYEPAPYYVQRSLRPGYNTDEARRTAMVQVQTALNAGHTIFYHLSGSNWQEKDVAPTKSSTSTLVYQGTASGAQGLDEVISLVGGTPSYDSNRTLADLALIRNQSGHASDKIALVLHNIPNGMQTSDWPTEADSGSRTWPKQAQWGITAAGASIGIGVILDAIFTRYGESKFRCVTYGQEMKGVYGNSFRQSAFPSGFDGLSPAGSMVGTSLTYENLREFIRGYNRLAKYMRTKHSGVQIWAPHWDFFARDSAANEQATIDRLLAGNNDFKINATTESSDSKFVTEFLNRVGYEPDSGNGFTTFNSALLPDVITIDVSIANGFAPRWQNDYANTWSRTALIQAVTRALRSLMTAKWGSTIADAIKIWAIESYTDVDQAAMTLSADQQAALTTRIVMDNVKAGDDGLIGESRWEPQGGDLSGSPTFPNKYVSFQSWWSPYNPVSQTDPASPYVYTYEQFNQTRDLSNLLPPGTQWYAISTDDSNIVGIASASKAFLLNGSSVDRAVRTTVNGTTVLDVVVPAYRTVQVDLPTATTQGITGVGGIGSAEAFGALLIAGNVEFSDAFGRTVSSGWGTADSGQTWEIGGTTTTAYNVDGSRGTFTHNATAQTRRAWLSDLTTRINFDVRVNVKIDKVP